MIGLIKKFAAKILGRLVIFKSHEFRLSALDLVRRTPNLRRKVSPLSLYLFWRHNEIKRLDLDFYRDHPVLGDIYKGYYGKIDRIALAISFLRGSLCVPGDVAEFGTYKGHTAISLNRVLNEAGSDKKLYLFDSFAGMPDTSNPLDTIWEEGDLTSDEQEVRDLFKDSPRVEVVPGFFRDSLPNHPDLKFSFCHIDADIYSSVQECIAYILPRLSVGGIILFDDYGFPETAGGKAAIEEVFGGEIGAFVPLPTAQAVYFSRAGDGVLKD